MQFTRSLRTRIIVAFVIFGTVMSCLFAISALSMRGYLENLLIDETLSNDLDAQLNMILSGGQVGAFSSRYYAWIGVPESANNLIDALPADRDLPQRRIELLSLPSGLHSLDTTNHSYRIAVDKRPDLWGYVVYDATPDPREGWLLASLLAGAFVSVLLLSLGLARWSSKKVMAPVSNLAKRIAGMGDDIHPEPLAPNYADDEVGQLAGALDEYAERLTMLVARDKEFNADVSHELRTPLAVIKGATELLQNQHDLSERTLERVTRIERAAKQSIELTEALLHLVRAERSSQVTAEYSRVDKIVEEAIEFKQSLIGRKPVEVRLHINNPFLVAAPESVISVAAGNLIGNAFKYTPQGSVDITVGENMVVVEDTGPGLKEDELQRIFTRHYRGSSATGKGSGLGLAIVQRFCNLYDWQVRIESRTGGGLRATLSFLDTAEPLVSYEPMRRRRRQESAD